MTEEERRYPYRYDRVLIDAARVLSPELPGITITLSGAHVEMLRNLMLYLDRPTSFVATYEEDTYLVPDDTDLETIATVVAELEYKLMGSENLSFGINERWAESSVVVKDGAGTFEASSTPVPAGYYYVMQRSSFANFSGQRGVAFISIVHDGTTYYALAQQTMLQYEPLAYSSPLVLSEGDYVKFSQGNVLDLDSLRYGVWGYKIKIP